MSGVVVFHVQDLRWRSVGAIEVIVVDENCSRRITESVNAIFVDPAAERADVMRHYVIVNKQENVAAAAGKKEVVDVRKVIVVHHVSGCAVATVLRTVRSVNH